MSKNTNEETTEIAISPEIRKALEKREIDEPLWAAIMGSVFPGAHEQSVLMAVDYCKARGLDILKKPCHIVPMSVKDARSGKYLWRDVIMPGIAESRITASRTGSYAGQDEPVYGPFVTVQIGSRKHEVPEYCTVTVYRMLQGEKVGFAHTEFFEEACATTKEGELNTMWSRRKRGQLAKCAEAGALRKAFPEETGGIATAEEYIDVETTDLPGTGRGGGQEPDRPATRRRKPNNPFDRQLTGGDQAQDDKPEQDAKPRQDAPAKEGEHGAGEGKAPSGPGQEPDPDIPEGMSLVYLHDIEVREGKTGERNWTRYRCNFFDDGNEVTATTFSETLGKKAESLKGGEVWVAVQETEKGPKLTDIRPAEKGDVI